MKKNGFIVAITDLVVDEVCKDLLTWIEKKKIAFVVLINITTDHIVNLKLIRKLIVKFESFQVPAKYLEFEVTEFMAIEDFNFSWLIHKQHFKANFINWFPKQLKTCQLYNINR